MKFTKDVKICRGCLEIKKFSEFWKEKHKLFNLSHLCKSCSAIRLRERYRRKVGLPIKSKKDFRSKKWNLKK